VKPNIRVTTPARCAGVTPAAADVFDWLFVEGKVVAARLFRGLLWLAAIALFYLAVVLPMPGGEQGHLSVFDKATHLVAYGGLTLLGLLGRYAPVRLAIALAAHGALIELAQGAFTTHRTASLGDWLADVMGIAGMLMLAAIGRCMPWHASQK
jgi:VanZ family protein